MSRSIGKAVSAKNHPPPRADHQPRDDRHVSDASESALRPAAPQGRRNVLNEKLDKCADFWATGGLAWLGVYSHFHGSARLGILPGRGAFRSQAWGATLTGTARRAPDVVDGVTGGHFAVPAPRADFLPYVPVRVEVLFHRGQRSQQWTPCFMCRRYFDPASALPLAIRVRTLSPRSHTQPPLTGLAGAAARGIWPGNHQATLPATHS